MTNTAPPVTERAAHYTALAEARGLTVRTEPYPYDPAGVALVIAGTVAGEWLQIIITPSVGTRTSVSAYGASYSGAGARKVPARGITTRINGMHPAQATR